MFRISLLALVLAVPLVVAGCAKDGGPPPPKAGAVGTMAADFAGTTRDGKTVRVSDYRGKTLLLNFMGPTCEICRVEYPHLIAYRDKHAGPRFDVLSVALTEPEWHDIDRFLGKMKPRFAIVLPDQDPGAAYDISPLPLNVVVGPDGHIAERWVGFSGPAEFESKVTPHIIRG